MTRGGMRRGGALYAALLTAGLLAFGSAPARAESDHERALALREAGEIVPFGLILARTMDHHPGRVLRVKFEDEDARYLYEVEVLDGDGVVWALFFDARTGELIEKVEEEEELRREGD